MKVGLQHIWVTTTGSNIGRVEDALETGWEIQDILLANDGTEGVLYILIAK